MKIRLICIQKNADSRIDGLIEEYLNRLKHYASFNIEYLEVNKKFRKLNPTDLLKVEEELIFSKLKTNSKLVLLDDKGKSFTSEQFANEIQLNLNASTQDLVYCIGGAYGFSQNVYSRANQKISLSRMTFTHQMVRVFFVEQLYRAFTIIKGEKYHH